MSYLLRFVAIFIAGVAMTDTINAQDRQLPTLHTNQEYVEEVTRPSTLAVADPMAVFGYVFDNLSEQVKVYPTENYYYFSFFHNGSRYAGNIRIEPGDGDKVTVHFAYYEDLSEWREDTPMTHIVLDASRGVSVERIERLRYRLSYGARSVEFSLNDLSQVKPPVGSIGPNETYIGPIFDESAIRFFLVYNSKLKLFHYILDETTKVADDFFASRHTDRIVIGRRTGFAFYRDRLRDRKILIGVYEGNYRLNTYFDGPFDQLPDNFIEGEALRNVILDVAPGLKGKIDRFGSSFDGSVRYLIAPYAAYRSESDLYGADKCATRRIKSPWYYQCFVAEQAPSYLAAPTDIKKRPAGLKIPAGSERIRQSQ